MSNALAKAAIVVEVALNPNVAHDPKAPLNPDVALDPDVARDAKAQLDPNVAHNVEALLLVILVVSPAISSNVNVAGTRAIAGVTFKFGVRLRTNSSLPSSVCKDGGAFAAALRSLVDESPNTGIGLSAISIETRFGFDFAFGFEKAAVASPSLCADDPWYAEDSCSSAENPVSSVAVNPPKPLLVLLHALRDTRFGFTRGTVASRRDESVP